MIFKISRTSSWPDKKGEWPIPCEEAKKIKLEGDEKPSWCVRIRSLKDLVALTEKYGEIIVDKNTLEIYDDYRE